MNKKIVLVGGCFDLLHYGHFKFFQQAKQLGNYLIVALESDEKIIQAKKRKPFHIQSQRSEILQNIKIIDEVICLPIMSGYEEYLELVQKIKPAFIAITEGDPQYINKLKQANSIGAQLVTVTPNVESFSTSKLIAEF